MPPGIPPFGFRDPDWTVGPEAEVYSGSQPKPDENKQENLPPAITLVNISVTYSSVFGGVTGTILTAVNSGKHARDEDSENVSSEPPSKRNHYTDWPEGVLRSLCSERDISSFGEKSEVVARLIQFDAAEAERHGGADEITPEAPEEPAA